MAKLLSANFARLGKEPALWLGICGIFLVALIGSFQSAESFRASLESGFQPRLEDYYFQMVPLLGVAFAVFVSLFLGTEYSDGVLRNKLTIGHTRPRLYLANGLACFFACLCFTAAYFLGGLPGVLLMEPFQMGWVGFFQYGLVSVAVTASFAALYTGIAMASSNKTLTLLFNLGLWLILTLAASAVNDRLSCPEFTGGMAYIDGQYVMQEMTPNPLYVSGALRTGLECLLELLPTGQLILIHEARITHPVRQILLSLALALTAVLWGMAYFRRKDIK